VRSLLAQWRQERREKERKRRIEEIEERQDRRVERDIILTYGGGARRRRRIKGMFELARQQGLRAQVEMSIDRPWKKPNRTRGRKRRAGLAVPLMPQE
jgi:hypothetical protein